MADGGHLESREIVISQRKSSDFDEIWYTTADLELDNSHMTKYELFKQLGWPPY